MRSDAPAVPPLPSLVPFLSRLASLVSSPFCPPSLFLHDPKQSPVLVHAILQLIHAGRPPSSSDNPPQVGDLLPVVAHLDLAQLHSVKQALDRILAQFSGHDLASGNSITQWDERNQGVKVWDGHALENLRVVETSRSRKRPAASNDGETHTRKRKRVRRSEMQLNATSDSDQDGAAGEDMASETEASARWSLEWDPEHAEDHSGSSTQATLAPFRNSLDAFHDSLRNIFAFADKHSSTVSPNDDEAGLPQRRFIVLEHGELSSELAGAGKASGAAARETGVGVTFASTIHRLAELTGLPITVITVSRLPWRKLRESMVGLPSPETLTFEDVSSDDVVALLTNRFATANIANPSSSSSETLRHDELVELFRSLVFIVRSTFGKVVTDLEDFAYLTAKFWPRWKAVREQSNPPIAPTDVARLSIALKPEFSAELDKMFLPRATLTAVPPAATVRNADQMTGGGGDVTPSSSSAQPLGFTGKIASLPKQPTFLAPVAASAEGSSRDPFSRAAAAAAAADDGPDAFFSSAASSATPSPVKQPVPVSSHPFATPSTMGPSRALAAAGPQQQAATTSTTSSSSHAALAKSLPLAARYLLIAAYFAAHNPPKSDVRMFVRVDDLEGVPKKGKKVKRGGGTAKKMGRSPSKAASATSLSGGKAFAYERLVAIFDSIVDSRLEYALGCVSIAAQVNTLVQLRLLQRVSSENNADKVLDGVKLRCGLARDTVEALAVSVGWKEWKERLVGEQE